jgi:NTP pyrophosphatase (non-canonical NTP hydrolase)
MKNTIKKLITFRDARNWQGFHTEAELARSLMIEGAELNRMYQWQQSPTDERLAEEVADCMIYALYLCEKRGLDPVEIVNRKIEKNGEKYPIG